MPGREPQNPWPARGHVGTGESGETNTAPEGLREQNEVRRGRGREVAECAVGDRWEMRSGPSTVPGWETDTDLLHPNLSLLLLLGFHKGCGVKTGRTTT